MFGPMKKKGQWLNPGGKGRESKKPVKQEKHWNVQGGDMT